MKTLLILLSALMLLASCKKDNFEQITVDINLHIQVKDPTGTDLLNPNNSNAIDISQVKVFFLQDGIKKEVFNPNLDSPKSFSIVQGEFNYNMILYPNNYSKEEFPITYIQWGSEDVDTIQCAYKRPGGSVICTKVWLNKKVVWDAQTANAQRGLTIVKGN